MINNTTITFVRNAMIAHDNESSSFTCMALVVMFQINCLAYRKELTIWAKMFTSEICILLVFTTCLAHFTSILFYRNLKLWLTVIFYIRSANSSWQILQMRNVTVRHWNCRKTSSLTFFTFNLKVHTYIFVLKTVLKLLPYVHKPNEIELMELLR